MKPERLRISRTKGSRLSARARVVARPTRYGNPFSVIELYSAEYPFGPRAAAQRVVDAHRAWMTGKHHPMHDGRTLPPVPDLTELRGRPLACWCHLHGPDGRRWPCHADTLIELANPDGDET